MRLWCVLVVVAGVLLVSAPAHADDPVALRVSVPKAQFSPDETVPLSFTVDRSGADCTLVAVADGTVQITSVTRDGAAVAAEYGTVDYYNGVEDVLRSRLVTAPRASFTSAGLVAVVPMPGGDGVSSRWDTATPGHYRVSLTYQAPALDGVSTCTAASGTATVAFTVAGARGFPWLGVVLAGVVALVVLAGVGWLLWRRRRGTATVVVVLLLVSGLAVDAHRADARVVSDLQTHDAVEGCLKKISAAGDPAHLLPYATDPHSPPIRVHGVHDPRDSRPSSTLPDGSIETRGNSKHPADGSDITWDPDPSFSLDGQPVDDCAALYHEMAHAVDYDKGALGDAMCGSSGVMTKEVRATTAENAYRSAAGLGTRKSYHGTTLPDPSSCEGPAQDELRKQGVCAKADVGTCSRTDGDPHLETYDHRRFDLQLVGEFVATRATTGAPLEIQVRQVPAGASRSLSVNGAVALRMGTHRLGFYLSNGDIVVHRDGVVAPVPRGDTALPDGGTLTRRDGAIPYSGDGYTVVWPDGSALWLDRVGGWGLRVMTALAPARAGKVTGLLGNDDGDAGNDATTGDPWHVTDASSLFDYPAGQTTATYTDRTFPDRPADVPPARAAAARELCQQLGVTDQGRLDECVLDVVVTGQPLFAVSAAQSAVDDPPVAGDAVRDGGSVNGTLGAAKSFPLDLAGAPGLWVDDTTGDCGVTVSVVPPSGKPFDVSGCYQLPVAVRSPATALRVTGTGKYNARVVSFKPRTVNSRLGTDVNGSLDVPGRVDELTFDASGSTGVRVSGGSGTADACHRVQLRVFNAGTGERVGLDVPGRLCDGLEQDLPDPRGRYYLEVLSYGGAPLASYHLHLEGTR